MGAVLRALICGATALAFIVTIFGVAVLSERQADAGTVTPLVRLEDVVQALRDRDLSVLTTGKLVIQPRLGVSGEEVLVNGEPVVVFIFPNVTERAAADQLLRSQHRFLAGDEDDRRQGPRIVAARNALLLHDIPDDVLAALIYRAAGELSSADRPS